MSVDPLIVVALLGISRLSVLPPPADPLLETTRQAIDTENPAAAVLQGLALSRALHRAGTRSHMSLDCITPCSPESREQLSDGAVDILTRLLSGDFPETLPEWPRLALAFGRIVSARVLLDLLRVATKDHQLHAVIPALTGERGQWIARHHREFLWLLEGVGGRRRCLRRQCCRPVPRLALPNANWQLRPRGGGGQRPVAC